MPLTADLVARCGPDAEIDELCVAFAEAMPTNASHAVVAHRLCTREVLVPAGSHGTRRQSIEVMELVEVARGWPLLAARTPSSERRPPGDLADSTPTVWLLVCQDGSLRWAIDTEAVGLLDGGPLHGSSVRDALLRGLDWDQPDLDQAGATLVERRALVPSRMAKAMVTALGTHGLADR
jgi:hypothetical protein